MFIWPIFIAVTRDGLFSLPSKFEQEVFESDPRAYDSSIIFQIKTEENIVLFSLVVIF